MKISNRVRSVVSDTIVALAGAITTAQAQTLPPPPVSPAPVVNYEYDAQGNPTKTVQAPGTSNFTTRATYDALNRMKDTTDANSGVTRFGYDGLDRTTQVTDPRNLVTQYPRNGLGDTKQLISPDTGTATLTYDTAGNLKTRTDSRGVKATFYYDVLDRLTALTYSQTGQTSISFVWQYDLAGVPYSIGRLGSANFPGGSLRYTYDAHGRVLTQRLQLAATAGANAVQLLPQAGYGYDAAGHVTSIVYPSGRKLAITYTGGVPTAIALAPTATAAATALVSQIQWQPFGPAKSWQWQLASGPQAHERVYDTSGRPVRYRLGNTVRDLTYDAADRISAYTHYDAASGAAQPSLNQGFGYDELGRLTQTTLYAGSLSFSYDANGNRTAASIDGNARSYAISATSNRIDSISNPARSFSYDPTGNTTADGQFSAGYDLTGRMKTLTKAGITATYTYDNDGRRVRKFDSTGAASTVVFFHDLDGHLLGEYDQTGKAIREFVWLGDTPIAVFTPDPVSASNPPLVYFIHTDHLDTPRVIVDKNNALRWRWFAEPFGTTVAESNPSGLGAFTFNLRFPGQYFDQESGLHYNEQRTLDTSINRYTTSDPIGLDGGLNTYAYVENNPLMLVDPNGLDPWAREAPWEQHPFFVDNPNRQRIADVATGLVRRDDWRRWKPNPTWRYMNKFKCNIFVSDSLGMAGVAPGLAPNGRPWLANDWYQGRVPGFTRVPDAFVRPGDIAAQSMPGHTGYTGHVGIVVGPGRTVSQSSRTDDVDESSWGFRPEERGQIRYYRCECQQ